MAIKVKLRQKEISGNRKSLYLDFYPAITITGTNETTRREFLGLWIFEKPKSAADKLHNKDTIEIAEQIRQRRDNQLNKPEIYTSFEKAQLIQMEREQKSFLEYFDNLAQQRKASNHDNWVSAQHYLKRFCGGDIKFAEVNEKFCNDFKYYLLTTKRSIEKPLAQNSVVSYFNKFKAALKQAYKENYLSHDINNKIDSVKYAETNRKFLTLEELNQLAKTECTLPVLKRAALFSALTGLRFSDIAKMTWSEVEFINNQGYFLHFKQKKTKGVEVMPISDQAFSLLGNRNKDTENVFPNLKYSAWNNTHLIKWLAKAGITKNITFHCFRHTFATLQLSNGTDIYTLSKLLGHRDLKTTQVYAKVIDSTKRQAVDKIKIEFN